jgi:hypothetical protein
MLLTKPAILLATLAGIGFATLAEPATAQERAGRYTMTPTEGGALRLDTETGAVSFCSRKTGDWACAAVGDPPRADVSEIERLKAENTDLRAAVKHLEEMLGVGGNRPPGSKAERPGGGVTIPSEKDVDEALDYVERMYKKFRDRLRQLDGAEKGKGQPL